MIECAMTDELCPLLLDGKYRFTATLSKARPTWWNKTETVSAS